MGSNAVFKEIEIIAKTKKHPDFWVIVSEIKILIEMKKTSV